MTKEQIALELTKTMLENSTNDFIKRAFEQDTNKIEYLADEISKLYNAIYSKLEIKEP